MKPLSSAEFFINMARAMLLLSIAKFMFDETGQIWMVSISFISEIFISACMPLLAGKYVDNHGVSGILRGVAAMNIFTSLVTLLIWYHAGLSAGLILFISIVLSALWRMSRLCVFNLIPTLLTFEKLEWGNGKLTFNSQLGQLIGMISAGGVLYFLNFPTVIGVVSFCFIMAAIGYIQATSLPTHNGPATELKCLHLPQTINSLISACKRYGLLFVISDFDFTVLAIFNILLASIVSENFGGNALWMSGIDACYALGAITGGALVSHWQVKTRYWHVTSVQLIFLVWLGTSAAITTSYLIIIASFIMGYFTSFSGIYWRTFLQQKLPTEIRGTLTGVKFILSSLWIGMVSLFISWIHQFGFDKAIYSSLAIVTLQLLILSYYKKTHLTEKNKLAKQHV